MAGYGSPMYGSPAPGSPMPGSSSLPAPPASTSHASSAFGISRPKPAAETNKGGLFANDGSFLARFGAQREDDDEKKKAADALARKKAMEDRFKKRGKRPATAQLGGDSASPSPGPAATVETSEPASKRVKSGDNKADDAYRREMRKHSDRSLKEEGSGVRSLVR